MPTVAENASKWGRDYVWTEGGNEWSVTWGGVEMHWHASLLPRLRGFLPAPRILEIAPGHGRWVPFLLDQCESYVGVDVAQQCVDVCNKRFAGEARAAFHVNDGLTLPMIEDTSIDFAFSFDSLVHVGREVIASYVRELARVLKPGGVAFLHHSNMGEYAAAHRRAEFLERAASHNARVKRVLQRREVIGWTHWRDPSMTAGAMVTACRSAGLACVGQEIVTWGGMKRLIDCFSVIARPDSEWDAPLVVERNRHFMGEAYSSGHASRVFARFAR